MQLITKPVIPLREYCGYKPQLRPTLSLKLLGSRALDVIGEKWSLLILRDLTRKGQLRFQELEAGLPAPSVGSPGQAKAGTGVWKTRFAV